MRDLYSHDVETAAALAREDMAPWDDRPSSAELAQDEKEWREYMEARYAAARRRIEADAAARRRARP